MWLVFKDTMGVGSFIDDQCLILHSSTRARCPTEVDDASSACLIALVGSNDRCTIQTFGLLFQLIIREMSSSGSCCFMTTMRTLNSIACSQSVTRLTRRGLLGSVVSCYRDDPGIFRHNIVTSWKSMGGCMLGLCVLPGQIAIQAALCIGWW